MGSVGLSWRSRARSQLTQGGLALARRALFAAVVTIVALGVAYTAGIRLIGQSGQALYVENCVTCHGPKGSRIPAAPLDSPAFVSRLGEASLYRTIAEGRGTMPAWGKVRGGPLADDEIKRIVGFLLSPERAGPGREIYQQQCASCHGEQGNRIPAALLSSRETLDRKSDADLTKLIVEGKGSMGAFGDTRGGPLNDQDVRAVLVYVRTLAGSVDPGTLVTASAPAGASAAAPAPAQRAGAAAGPADHGQDLFKQNCSLCHGSLSLPQATAAGVQQTITEGIAAKGMPAFGGKLPNDDIQALAQFVTSGKAATVGGGAGNPFAGIVRHVEGWITKHPSVVKENGSQLCAKCHQPSFCAGCHTGGRIKP